VYIIVGAYHKMTQITPIPKNLNTISDISTYIPIVVSNIISKIYSYIIEEKMKLFVRIINNQYGFRDSEEIGSREAIFFLRYKNLNK